MIHNIPPSAIIVRLFANSDNYYSPIVSPFCKRYFDCFLSGLNPHELNFEMLQN